MSSQQDLIKLNEVVAECTRLLKEQAEGWQSIVKEIKNVNQSAPSSYIKMQKEAAQSIIQLEKAEQEYQKTLQQKQKLEQQILVTERQTVQLSETQRRASEAKERSAQRAVKQALEQNSAYLKLQNNWRQAQRTYADLLATIGSTPTQLNKAKREFDQLDARIKKIDSATKNYSKTVGNYGSAMAGLGSQLAGALGWAGAISTLVSLGKSFYDTTKQLQTLHKSMELGAKDSQSYASNLAFLNKITEDYGLELLTTSQAYNKFYIASKNKLALEDIQMIFDKVSKSASLMGMSVYEQEGIFKALEQMMSKGTVQAEELRGQLGDRLPGAFEIMANAMGVTTEQLGKMMKDGEVIASEVLPKFAVELEKAFGADKVSKVENLTSAENRLKNEWTSLVQEMTGSEGTLTGFFTGFINWLARMVDGLKNVITLYGAWIDVSVKLPILLKTLAVSLIGFSEVAEKAFKFDFTGAYESFKKNFTGIKNIAKSGYNDIVKTVQEAGKKITKENQKINNINGWGSSSFMNDSTPKDSKKGKKKKDTAEKDRLEALRIAYELQVSELNLMEEGQAKELALLQAWYEYQNEIDRKHIDKLLTNTNEYFARLRKINEDGAKKLAEAKDKENKAFLKEQDELFKEDEQNTKEYNESVAYWDDWRLKKRLENLDKEGDEVNRQMERIKGYLSQSSDLGNFGFSSLNMFTEVEENGNSVFENMLKNAEDFKEKFAVIVNAIGDIFKDVFNAIEERQNAYFEKQFKNLETEKDVSIKFAGENTAGREAIEKQYEEKKRALQMQQAKQQKQMAIAQARINIAMGITAALTQIPPYSFILAGLVGVLGAIQIANIASTPLPGYWTGRDGGDAEWALTQEKGAEMITDKNGKIKTIGNNKGAQLTYLNKGDKVFTADETTQKLNELLIGSGVAPIVNTNVNNGLTESQMRAIMQDTLAKQPRNTISLDEGGFKSYQQKEDRRTILKNRNVKI